MIKNFILICLGAFIVSFFDNHFDNSIVNIIISAIGYGLIFCGYGNILTKPLLKRIKALNFHNEIDNYFLQAIEEGFEDNSFILHENEIKENKEYIDLYRRKHGSIVYTIEYELDKDINWFYNCKFVKAYDLNEKEWIDEENKTIHLFRNRNYLHYVQRVVKEKKETEVEFNNKKYLCYVTSCWLVDEYDENGDMMMEIELHIIKEINKTVTVSSKDGSYEHTYIE